LIQALREANLYHLAEPSHCLHHLDPLSLHCLRTRTHQGLNSNSYRSCQRSCLYIAIVGSMNKWSYFEWMWKDILVDRSRKLVLHASWHWWSQLCELAVLHMCRVRERGGCHEVDGNRVDSHSLLRLRV
jgi:hypothetical protein